MFRGRARYFLLTDPPADLGAITLAELERGLDVGYEVSPKGDINTNDKER